MMFLPVLVENSQGLCGMEKLPHMCCMKEGYDGHLSSVHCDAFL